MSKIKIKESNKGKFTSWAKSHGMTVQQAARTILRNREKYSPTLIKRAQFARNASKWVDGGEIQRFGTGGYGSVVDDLLSGLGALDTSSNNKYLTIPEKTNKRSYTDYTYFADRNKYMDTANSLTSAAADSNPYAAAGKFLGESASDFMAPKDEYDVADSNLLAGGASALFDPKESYMYAANNLFTSDKTTLKHFDTGDLAFLNAALPQVGGALLNEDKRRQRDILKMQERQDVQSASIAANTPTGPAKSVTFKFGGKFKGKTFGSKDGNSLVQDGEIILGTKDNKVQSASNPNAPIADNIPMDFADGTKIISRKNSTELLKDVKKYNKAQKMMEGGVSNISKNSLTKNANKYYSKFLAAYDAQEAKKFAKGGKKTKFATAGEYDGPESDYRLRQGNPLVGEDYFNSSGTDSSLPFSYADFGIAGNNKYSNADGTGRQPWTMDRVGGVASELGMLAPSLYNLGQGLFGKREYLNANDYRNPYESKINSLMANRQYEIGSGLRGNEAAYRTLAANLRNSGAAPKGKFLSNLTAGQNSKMFADMALRDQQNNVNNQYAGEYANTLYGLGRDRSAMRYSVDEGNLMTKAAGRNMTSSGLTGIQNYLAINQQKAAQAQRDQMLLDAIKGYSPHASEWLNLG